MLRARGISVQLSTRFKTRPFCTNNSKNALVNNNGGGKMESSIDHYTDGYKQLQNLDFMTATKMLFTQPSTKKFGLDFHLVQLFFVCMPSLAVYLVAQYARYEMRKMDADLARKKKIEDEKKAKEEELKAIEEMEAGPGPEILEVKERLDKLEEVVKEFAVIAKKQSGNVPAKQEATIDKKQVIAKEETNVSSLGSEQTKSSENALKQGKNETGGPP